MSKLQKMKEWSLFFTGTVLVLIGCVFIFSPFPVGLVFITSGLSLMAFVNNKVRRFVKQSIRRCPKIESKLPQKIKNMLDV